MIEMDFLSETEIDNLKGGTLEVSSSESPAIQMGNSSCCNIGMGNK